MEEINEVVIVKKSRYTPAQAKASIKWQKNNKDYVQKRNKRYYQKHKAAMKIRNKIAYQKRKAAKLAKAALQNAQSQIEQSNIQSDDSPS